MDDERPTVHCFVAIEIRPGVFTEPALVSLEIADELRQKGYRVVGPDPRDLEVLSEWERAQQWLKPRRKWFEQE